MTIYGVSAFKNFDATLDENTLCVSAKYLLNESTGTWCHLIEQRKLGGRAISHMQSIHSWTVTIITGASTARVFPSNTYNWSDVGSILVNVGPTKSAKGQYRANCMCYLGSFSFSFRTLNGRLPWIRLGLFQCQVVIQIRTDQYTWHLILIN